MTYCLDLRGQGGQGRIVHVNLLKPWQPPTVQVLSVALLTEETNGDPGELITMEAGCTGHPEIDNDLNPKQRTEVSALIAKYKPLFSWTQGRQNWLSMRSGQRGHLPFEFTHIECQLPTDRKSSRS